ncbi:MAG: diaminopimelate epimerase [Gemmatimonadota bacterium]|nr:diaminopimelate epimerase [Gemmatimonadota bacterium]MDH3368498.1 diaminopimelate epimerase [Gemmatimonadota bacterium]MDH5550402.1 diaminopimelate epimerase [Gemmatimonadota bacterium]
MKSLPGWMDGLVAYKMTGSGNDFVLVDGRIAPPDLWDTAAIQAVCDRHLGVGADGLVILEPGMDRGKVRFHFFNQDGSRGAMCGNAALCATRLSAWLELAPSTGMVLDTDAGPVRSRCLHGEEQRAELELPPPSAIASPQIPLETGERSIRLVTVGVPHLVVQVEALRVANLMDRGRALRSHPECGAGGANVNFVGPGASGGWGMRTFERGVEGETLACGTGAVAAAAVLRLTSKVDLPLDIQTASERTLTVSAQVTRDGILQRPRLAGEGRLVFRAILGATSQTT